MYIIKNLDSSFFMNYLLYTLLLSAKESLLTITNSYMGKKIFRLKLKGNCWKDPQPCQTETKVKPSKLSSKHFQLISNFLSKSLTNSSKTLERLFSNFKQIVAMLNAKVMTFRLQSSIQNITDKYFGQIALLFIAEKILFQQ